MKKINNKDSDNLEILRTIVKKPNVSQRELSKKLGF